MYDLISIIIPVYNVEQYLRECIESVISQEYLNLEILLIDDGSTDSSGRICDEYGEKYENIKVVHTENCGVSAARNRGLDMQKGDYVLFVDSDDKLLPGAVKTLHENIIHTKADMCVGKVINTINKKKEDKYVQIINNEKRILECILDDRFYSCYGKIIKRKIVERVRFVEGRKIHEDGFYIFQCLILCKRIAVINAEVYYYLYRSDSACHQPFSKKFYDILYFKTKKIDIICEKYPNEQQLIGQIAFKHDLALLNKMASCDIGYSPDEIITLRETVIKELKYVHIKSLKEKIRIFLIKHLFPVYLKVMRRNL